MPHRIGRHGLVALAVCGLALAGCGARDGRVSGSGTIEMDEVDVASLVGGRVREVRVAEGDSVRAGDTLAVLSAGEVEAVLEQRRGEVARAQAQLRDVEAGPRTSEIRAAAAERDAARSQAALARAELARLEPLAAQQLVSPSELDRARTAASVAEARHQAAERALDLLRAGSRAQQIAAARGGAAAARGQLEAAATRVGELVLTAPSDGVVLLRNLDPGEIAAAGVPVVTLGDPRRLWMRVYVATPDLDRVALGAPAEVRVPAMGHGRWAARVVEIATRAEYTPRAALTEEERANLVFGVKLAIEPGDGTLKAGLPADARIGAATATRAP